ncbi:MAG: DUF6152 family protein [Terriglobia bacterium]
MAMKRLAVGIIAAVLLVGARPMFAHHSLSIYDADRDFTLTGIATEFMYVNPHAQLRFDVKGANGIVEGWSVETSGVRRLETAGWNKETIKPGDQVTVIGRRIKDGSKKMFMERIVVNGKEYERGRR